MKRLKNSSGQFLVEGILLLTVLMASTIFIAKYFKENNLIAQLISAPWQSLSGMLQNGVWAPPAKSMSLHPNKFNRHSSLKGESPT